MCTLSFHSVYPCAWVESENGDWDVTAVTDRFLTHIASAKLETGCPKLGLCACIYFRARVTGNACNLSLHSVMLCAWVASENEDWDVTAVTDRF